VSTPQPPRRRRIAGESKPGAPAPKASVVKRAAKRTAKKTPPPPPKPAAPEAPTRAATPPAPPTTTDASPRRFSMPQVSGRFAVLVALTVAALAFGAVFGIKGISDWRDESGIADAHDRAATAAAAAGETIFTYQYNQLDDHLKDSKALMTPSFGKKFESIAPALQDLAPQRKIQVKATVRNAAAVECGDKCSSDRATVLVFIDQARVADGDKEPTVFGNRIKLEMVHEDGSWLVNDVQAL
jgi:Mce-associated membrane protein